MEKSLEKLWVSLTGSAQFRKFASKGIGYYFFQSNIYRKLRFKIDFVNSNLATLLKPALFNDVRTLCLFVGHNKSGTSTLGSLLDAHPNIILADKMGVLEYASSGFSRSQIFHLLLKGSRKEFLKRRINARRFNPYSYSATDQWQGSFTKLHVIGAGKAGDSIEHIAKDPQLLTHLLFIMNDIDVKLIQVIRNPFDVISVMMNRGKHTFSNSINHYFTCCDYLTRLRDQMRTNLITVYYEDLVTYPKENLVRVCNFLDVEPHNEYLQVGKGILLEKPDCDRHKVEWTSEWKRIVEENLVKYDFLRGYHFES